MRKKILIFFIFIFCLKLVFATKIDISQYDAVKMDKSKIIFMDGDTVGYEDLTIRFLGVDTPEVAHEDLWDVSQYLGEEASEFTKKAITKAKKVYYIPTTKDAYNRILGHIVVDDELLAEKIIDAGLGYETITRYGDNGFLEFAKIILDTSDRNITPNFDKPFFWRLKHKKKGIK